MIRRKIVWADKHKAKDIYHNTKGLGHKELGENGWRKFRRMIRLLETEPYLELQRLHPFSFKQLSRDLDGNHSMRYNDYRRLVFSFVHPPGGSADSGCDVKIIRFRGHYGK